MYLALMRRLDCEYWLIAPDNPGFGLSDPLPGGFTVPGCAAAIDEFIERLVAAFERRSSLRILKQFQAFFKRVKGVPTLLWW